MNKLFTAALLFISTLGFGQAAQPLQIGPNRVEVIARHCAGYATAAACVADPKSIYADEVGHNLKTNAGVDFISQQISGSASTADGQWIALSTSSTAPSVSDTALASEITTNGLGRAQGTFAHTSGTATYTVSYTFTATGIQSNIWKTGVLTASGGGTLVYEILLGSAITMNTSDQLQVVWTVTIS